METKRLMSDNAVRAFGSFNNIVKTLFLGIINQLI